jgi:hypothetical protein
MYGIYSPRHTGPRYLCTPEINMASSQNGRNRHVHFHEILTLHVELRGHPTFETLFQKHLRNSIRIKSNAKFIPQPSIILQDVFSITHDATALGKGKSHCA